MPLPQNFNVLLGAGVFGIVCAATLYVVEHYRQDRRRHAMAKDLARLDTEMAVLREELNALLALQNKKAAKRGKRKKAESVLSSSTEDYSSAVDADSSDLEFYDVSDDEAPSLDNALAEIDAKLDDSTADLETCLRKLEHLCIEHPENPELLWRVGKAHFRLYEKTEHEDHLAKGVEACTLALNFPPELANVYKWLAILIGTQTKYMPIKEKIQASHTVEGHIKKGLTLNPKDPMLHHMMGRWAYDIAELKWYEKKVAAALFAEPPNATYEEALEHLREAEKLATYEWKENKLYIAKCLIKMGQIEEAVIVLEQADKCTMDNGADDKVDLEVKELLQKYSN